MAAARAPQPLVQLTPEQVARLRLRHRSEPPADPAKPAPYQRHDPAPDVEGWESEPTVDGQR